MAVGLSSTNLATKWLNVLLGTNFTAPASLWVSLHKGDPGAAGTSNVSGNSIRYRLNLAAPVVSGNTISVSLSGTPPTWTMPVAETLSHISVWDSQTSGSGNFLWSAALATSRTVSPSDTFTLTSCSLSINPVAS